MVQAVSGQVRRVLNVCENDCGMLAVMSDRLILWNVDSVTFCDRAMHYGTAKLYNMGFCPSYRDLYYPTESFVFYNRVGVQHHSATTTKRSEC
jgi:hypothetical protein